MVSIQCNIQPCSRSPIKYIRLHKSHVFTYSINKHNQQTNP
jgi:hypothetical protein